MSTATFISTERPTAEAILAAFDKDYPVSQPQPETESLTSLMGLDVEETEAERVARENEAAVETLENNGPFTGAAFTVTSEDGSEFSSTHVSLHASREKADIDASAGKTSGRTWVATKVQTKGRDDSNWNQVGVFLNIEQATELRDALTKALREARSL